MHFTDEERRVQDEACLFIVEHKNEFIDQFVLRKNPLRLGIFTIFMAGSPGAGKTEFSKRYMPLRLDKKDKRLVKYFTERGIDIESINTLFIRIDVDEIREFLPQYRKTDSAMGIKGNAHVIQKAANKGLDILRDYCLDNEISFLHDGTFSNYETMRELVKKSLHFGRRVQIYYLYLDPIVAWEFTKAREYLEGRNVVKEKFVEQYYKSRENVNRIKQEFGADVQINCVLKNSKNEVLSIEVDIENVDKFINAQYNIGVIQQYSQEDLDTMLR